MHRWWMLPILILMGCVPPLTLENRGGHLVPDARERVSPLVLGTPVVLVSRTGEVVSGTLLRLTDGDLFLRTPQGDTVKIRKSAVRCVEAEISPHHRIPVPPASPLLFYGGGGLGALLLTLWAGPDTLGTWKITVPYFSGMLLVWFFTNPPGHGPSSGRQIWTISSGRASPFRAYQPGFYNEGSWCKERISSSGSGGTNR